MEWLKLERPEPPRYHVLASDVEMCALWYDYARVHAGAELALLLDPPEARPSPPVASARNRDTSSSPDRSRAVCGAT
jgi:hypothetical protein